MLNLEFQELADIDLDFIFHFIADQDRLMAVKVIQKIYKTISNLKTFPYMGKINSFGLREIVEPKYKFRIIYEVNWDTIFIVSIFKNKNTF